jgi:hypothetical protein
MTDTAREAAIEAVEQIIDEMPLVLTDPVTLRRLRAERIAAAALIAYEAAPRRHVEKVRGYKWPGVIVAEFRTLAGERRLVVECTVPDVAGALHIYSPEQIRVMPPPPPPETER